VAPGARRSALFRKEPPCLIRRCWATMKPSRRPAGELRRRRGRPKVGYLDEHAAIVAKDRLVREVERELAERAATAERAANAPPKFRAVAHAYLDWLDRVSGAKPATLRDHGYPLAEPGAAHRRGWGSAQRSHHGGARGSAGERDHDPRSQPPADGGSGHGRLAANGQQARQLVCAAARGLLHRPWRWVMRATTAGHGGPRHQQPRLSRCTPATAAPSRTPRCPGAAAADSPCTTRRGRSRVRPVRGTGSRAAGRGPGRCRARRARPGT
jgi:hypothetical protein